MHTKNGARTHTQKKMTQTHFLLPTVLQSKCTETLQHYNMFQFLPFRRVEYHKYQKQSLGGNSI